MELLSSPWISCPIHGSQLRRLDRLLPLGEEGSGLAGPLPTLFSSLLSSFAAFPPFSGPRARLWVLGGGPASSQGSSAGSPYRQTAQGTSRALPGIPDVTLHRQERQNFSGFLDNMCRISPLAEKPFLKGIFWNFRDHFQFKQVEIDFSVVKWVVAIFRSHS